MVNDEYNNDPLAREAEQALYGEDAVLLAVVQSGRLLLFAHDLTPEPKPGDTLISLVLPTGSPESLRLKVIPEGGSSR